MHHSARVGGFFLFIMVLRYSARTLSTSSLPALQLFTVYAISKAVRFVSTRIRHPLKLAGSSPLGLSLSCVLCRECSAAFLDFLGTLVARSRLRSLIGKFLKERRALLLGYSILCFYSYLSELPSGIFNVPTYSKVP
ncbi:hypothetical protein DFP73DRAFT_542957 [Morchella snyderi]|nr:hypothetical protein DFP73DRAFT_542957 [Morchella snyderi]